MMNSNERAVQVRDLLKVTSIGTLCTHSAKLDGYPYGSVAPFAIDPLDGSPVFFFSQMAVHTKNLRVNAKASLLVSNEADGVAGGRVNLFGEIVQVPGEDDISRLRELYTECHPEASQWIQFDDFNAWRMVLADIYWVGGFGAMGWTPVDAYQSCLRT